MNDKLDDFTVFSREEIRETMGEDIYGCDRCGGCTDNVLTSHERLKIERDGEI